MAWIALLAASFLEVVWSLAMKQSDGFTRLWPSVLTITTMICSFVLLAISMKTLPLGTAYPIWTGIGAIGAFLVGVVILGEAASVTRIAAIVLIATGLVLMKIGSAP
ncbi:MAG: multidrug efflux SMR transporter [Hyphomicrobium sp.]|jgi:quaternary ammonium compound-resistance protein SugE|uniref:DMT family transporter n=1 Tax=Hyphomicrobium sp. TaxID=82 RepID=UPI0025C07983|nr:multidrug efflux SMR transporter [Hyphomicrobium sp.]MBX9864761.1 multidrug efflux SMR transporter [Hyphomicrobium sp.]